MQQKSCLSRQVTSQMRSVNMLKGHQVPNLLACHERVAAHEIYEINLKLLVFKIIDLFTCFDFYLHLTCLKSNFENCGTLCYNYFVIILVAKYICYVHLSWQHLSLWNIILFISYIKSSHLLIYSQAVNLCWNVMHSFVMLFFFT